MARYCNQCNKKFGFFEEDFDGMCRNCYDEFQRQEEIRKQEETRKRQKQLEEERQKQIQQQKQIQENKNKELKEKENYIKSLIMKYPRFTVVSSGILQEMFNAIENFKYNTDSMSLKNINLENILSYVIGKLPLNPTYKDVENINTYKDLIDLINEFNSIFNIDKTVLQEFYKEKSNNQIRDLYTYKETLFVDLGTLEPLYKFTLQLLDNSIYQCEMNGGEIMLNFAKKCQVEKKIESISYIYQYIMSLLYGLLFYAPVVEIIENDKELYVIFANLVNNKMDKEYISKKLFEMYENIYKSKFPMTLYQEDFNIVTVILISKICDFSKDNLKEYYTIDENKKINIKFENIPLEADELLFKDIVLDFIQNSINDIDFSQFIKLLSVFELTSKTFYDMAVSKRKQLIAEQEKERLLNGDMSKEIEMKKQAVEYSNVQNGYEFEEYVANLYKKLGYRIEEVTKKSGDQRCRCHCI